MSKPSAAPELEPVDTVEFDPWEKVLDALTEQRQDVKDIKRQLKVLNTNVELVRQAYVDGARRLTLLENECPRRNGTCPTSMTPIPTLSDTLSDDTEMVQSDQDS